MKQVQADDEDEDDSDEEAQEKAAEVDNRPQTEIVMDLHKQIEALC